MLFFSPACRAAVACLTASAAPAQGKVADATFNRTRALAWGDVGLRYGEGSDPAAGSFHLQSC